MHTHRDIRALTMGVRFAKCCQKECSASVLSVHRRVVNILVNDELLALVIPRAGGSSRFLCLNALPKLTVGEEVQLSPEALTIGNTRVDLSRVPLQESLLTPGKHTTLTQQSLESFAEAYAALGIKSGANPHCAITPKTVERWIGLGPGLTPAGDDVVLGYLAIDNHFGTDLDFTRDLHKAVSAALRRTTTLSAQLLKAALAGDYHESVERVVAILLGISSENLTTALRGVTAIGASSGASTVYGMWLALQDSTHNT